MGDHSWTDRPTREMLDQQMPLDRYSSEDRLNTLILHLRAHCGAHPARLREIAHLLGTPPGAVEALLDGDMQTMHAELAEHGGWPMLASLLGYGDGLNADLDILAAAQAEYEEMALGEQRLRLSISPSDLRKRGYQSGRNRVKVSVSGATSPGKVETYAELTRVLIMLRKSRGSPSYRDMSRRSERRLPGWEPHPHESRSHTALQRVIKPGATPKLPAVLAWVRGCGVTDPEVGKAWKKACARAAVHDELQKIPREPPRLEESLEDWIARSGSGPNPSLV